MGEYRGVGAAAGGRCDWLGCPNVRFGWKADISAFDSGASLLIETEEVVRRFGKEYDRLPGKVGIGFSPYGSVGKILHALKEFAFAGVTVDHSRDGAVTSMTLHLGHYIRSIPDDSALPLHGIEIDPICDSRLSSQLLPALRMGRGGDSCGDEHRSDRERSEERIPRRRNHTQFPSRAIRPRHFRIDA